MIEETSLSGVIIITPKWFQDGRSAFCETYSQRTWRNLGLSGEFVQDNQSISRETGTVRGLHFQRPPDGQAKLVRVIAGSIWDVAVDKPDDFRFHHISTDEVFGSLGEAGFFDETSRYDPRSPYSASKAGSDHLVRAWHETYGLPVVITNCSNNYGPRQFPEKLIPVTILNALAGKPLPVYGAGLNVRDWLHVEDHAAALLTVLTKAEPGATYAIGGNAEAKNIDILRAICGILDKKSPGTTRYAILITFVADRPGHDQRHAIDATRIAADLGWAPTYDLENGLAQTVDWYLENEDWWRPLLTRAGAGTRLGQDKL